MKKIKFLLKTILPVIAVWLIAVAVTETYSELQQDRTDEYEYEDVLLAADEIQLEEEQLELAEELETPVDAVATRDDLPPLRLYWEANDGNTHLSLNPANNQRANHVMVLVFAPRSDNIYAPGEIEIRLPRGLFKDRNGNMIHNVPTREGLNPIQAIDVALPGPTVFNYRLYDDEMIITNFDYLYGGSDPVNIQMGVYYLPSQSPNRFQNDFYATATFAERHNSDSLTSNQLSLDLRTRIVPSNSRKETMEAYRVWQTRWGSAPEGDLSDYFFVRYHIFHAFAATTTQMFSSQQTVTPLDGGEIVAWSNIHTANNVNPANFATWTHGTTADFNTQPARSWQFSLAEQHFSTTGDAPARRWQGIIVRYPRPDQPGLVFRSQMNVVWTPADHTTDPTNNPIIPQEIEASYRFDDIHFVYRGNLYRVRKALSWRPAAEDNSFLSVLEAGHDVLFTQVGHADRNVNTGNNIIIPERSVHASARGFSATEAGSRAQIDPEEGGAVVLRSGQTRFRDGEEDARPFKTTAIV